MEIPCCSDTNKKKHIFLKAVISRYKIYDIIKAFDFKDYKLESLIIFSFYKNLKIKIYH